MGPLLAHSYAVSGNKKEAEKIMAEVNELSKQHYVSAFHRSAIYLALKDNDQAFDLLDKAYEDRDNWLVTIKIDPRFDNVRSDSRYIQLLKKLNMEGLSILMVTHETAYTVYANRVTVLEDGVLQESSDKLS